VRFHRKAYDGYSDDPDLEDSDDSEPRFSLARVPVAVRWILVGAAVVVCLLGWFSFKAWQIDRALGKAEVDVGYLRVDLSAGRFTAFGPDADRLQRDATAASSASHDPVWVAASHLPWLGGNLRAATVVSRALERVVDGAIVPLSRSDSFRVIEAKDAGIGQLMTALGQDAAPIASAVAAVDGANKDVASVKTGSLFGFVSRHVVSAQAKLSRAAQQIDDLQRLAKVAPNLLGQQTPQNILLLFQTPAEERGTEGLVGAWGELRADKGKVTLEEFGSIDTLTKLPVAPAGVNPQIRAVYGPDVELPQNFNESASFPDAAQMFSASWTAGAGHGVIPDAVLSIDPVALGHMLSATGPVKTSTGLQVTAANAAELLLRQEYYTYPGSDQAPRVAFLGDVTTAVFAKLTKPGYSVGAVGRKIAQSVSEGRLTIWSPKPADEEQWVQLGVSGALGTPTDGTVRLALNSLDGSKLGAYLTTRISVTNSCTPGPQVAITFTSTAPLDIPLYAGTHVAGLDVTTMRLAYSLYVSLSWGVRSITVAGQKSVFSADKEGGWEVLRGTVDIPRASFRIVAVQLEAGLHASSVTTVIATPQAADVVTNIAPNVAGGSACPAPPNG
jgi:Protein of unknown function (DUF4012)